jgi:hypothetical protein
MLRACPSASRRRARGRGAVQMLFRRRPKLSGYGRSKPKARPSAPMRLVWLKFPQLRASKQAAVGRSGSCCFYREFSPSLRGCLCFSSSRPRRFIHLNKFEFDSGHENFRPVQRGGPIPVDSHPGSRPRFRINAARPHDDDFSARTQPRTRFSCGAESRKRRSICTAFCGRP